MFMEFQLNSLSRAMIVANDRRRGNFMSGALQVEFFSNNVSASFVVYDDCRSDLTMERIVFIPFFAKQLCRVGGSNDNRGTAQSVPLVSIKPSFPERWPTLRVMLDFRRSADAMQIVSH